MTVAAHKNSGTLVAQPWQLAMRDDPCGPPPDHVVQKVRELHMTVFPSMAWTSDASLDHSGASLRSMRTRQTRMTRRLGPEWPLGQETWPDYAGHISRWAEPARRVAKVSSWDEAVATIWWRWAGHLGRLHGKEAWRWKSWTVVWHAWWRNTMRGVCHTDADLGRPRFGRWHHHFGARRWGEVIQLHADAEMACEKPWYEHAQHRESWEFVRSSFVVCVTR